MDCGNKYCINVLLLNDHSALGNGMGVVFHICCDSVIPGKTHPFHKLKKESISNCQLCQHILTKLHFAWLAD